MQMISSDHQSLAPRVTLDLVVMSLIQQKLQVLLVKRNKNPFKNTWALPASDINIKQDKTLEQAAQNKLKLLLNTEIAYLEQVQTLGDGFRDPRGWSVTVIYYALLGNEIDVGEIATDLGTPNWFDIDSALSLDLAFDHKSILDTCCTRLQNKALYTSLPVYLLPQEFTLTELQKSFEAMLGFNIEKKSFRRRILEAKILSKTGNVRRAQHRPAELFCLNQSGELYYFNRILEGVRF